MHIPPPNDGLARLVGITAGAEGTAPGIAEERGGDDRGSLSSRRVDRGPSHRVPGRRGSRTNLRSYVGDGSPAYGWVLAAQVGQHRQHAAVVGLALA